MFRNLDPNRSVPSILRDNKERKARWQHLTEGMEADKDKVSGAYNVHLSEQERTYKRVVTEALLDNYDRARTSGELMEEVSTTAIAPFNKFAYPLIRRVYPKLLSPELFSVQPIPLPTALIFYYDWKYGTAQGAHAAGGRMDQPPSYKDYPASFGYTGPGGFNRMYAGGQRVNEPVAIGDGATVDFDLPDAGAIGATLAVYVNGAATAVVLGAGTGTGGRDRITFNPAPALDARITATYTVTPNEGSSAVRDVDYEITSSSVNAEQKKLKAKWTIESQQDLKAYHGIDAEPELLANVGNELVREIDRTLIEDCVNTATGGNVTFTTAAPPGDTTTLDKRAYAAKLYESIIDAGNLIYKKRYVQPSWIIGDVDSVARLEKLEEFRLSNASGDDGVRAMERHYLGTLNFRFKVYKDPWFPPNTLMLGYKGDSFLHAGYVYSPYILAYATPLFVDPADIKARRAMMSRYARKNLIPEMYSTVTIA